MEGDIGNTQMLLKKENKFKKGFKKLVQKIKESRTFLGIIMLVIGISWTVVYYEGQELYQAAQNLFAPRTLTFVNPVQAAETPKIEEVVPVVKTERLSALAKDFKLDESELLKTVATVKKVSEKEGFDWKIPMAIILTESKGGKLMVGDSGLSKGWYHIYHVNVCELNGNKKYCIRDEDRFNLEIATKWAVERLQRHENMGRSEMIRSHNGLISDMSNQWYVTYVEELIQKYF